MSEQPWREWDREALWRKLQEAERRLARASEARDGAVAQRLSSVEDMRTEAALYRRRYGWKGCWTIDRVATFAGGCLAASMQRAEAAEARVAELQQAADDWFERRVEIRARAEELAHFSPGDAYAQRVGRDLLDALDGPGLEPGGWQPIETKPQDGALVVGYLRRMECYEFVRWSESSALWMQDEVSGWRDDQLAAWAPLPLPPPPAGEESEEVGQ